MSKRKPKQSKRKQIETYLNRAFGQKSVPNNAKLYKKFPKIDKSYIRKIAKNFRAVKVAPKQLAPIAQKPKGRGTEIAAIDLSESLKKKYDFLRKIVDIEAKESIDGKLVYLSTNVSFDQVGLDILKSGPKGYLYKLSCHYKTTLIVTKEYKVIHPNQQFSSEHDWADSYRNIGTFSDEELNDIILLHDIDLEKTANFHFGIPVVRIVGLSAIIVDFRRKRKERTK